MTKIERISPELKALADKLGYKIHYRAGQYWAGSDIQLTYEVYKGVRLSLGFKIPYAIDILKSIDNERIKMRTPKERVKDLLELFDSTEYFPRNVFTEMNTPERDKLTVLNVHGDLTAWLSLIGEPKIEYKYHKDKKELLEALNSTLESYNINNTGE